MKTLLALAALVALCGCSSISGSRQAPDGSVLEIKSSRFFWASEGISFTLRDTNGVAVTLSVNKSGTDATAIAAVAEGVAKGVVAGAKP